MRGLPTLGVGQPPHLGVDLVEGVLVAAAGVAGQRARAQPHQAQPHLRPLRLACGESHGPPRSSRHNRSAASPFRRRDVLLAVGDCPVTHEVLALLGLARGLVLPHGDDAVEIANPLDDRVVVSFAKRRPRRVHRSATTSAAVNPGRRPAFRQSPSARPGAMFTQA